MAVKPGRRHNVIIVLLFIRNKPKTELADEGLISSSFNGGNAERKVRS